MDCRESCENSETILRPPDVASGDDAAITGPVRLLHLCSDAAEVE